MRDRLTGRWVVLEETNKLDLKPDEDGCRVSGSDQIAVLERGSDQRDDRPWDRHAVVDVVRGMIAIEDELRKRPVASAT